MRYSIVYADPPWNVERGPTGPGDWSRRRELAKIGTKAQALPYPTLSVSEICGLRVPDIAEPDSVLFLWTVNKYIPAAYQVAAAWGFKPPSLLTWCKPAHGLGLGGAFVQTTEHCLYARRGHLAAAKRIETTWFQHPRRGHSVKPDAFRAMIVQVFGEVPRIELFARRISPGWDVWGDEVGMTSVPLAVVGS